METISITQATTEIALIEGSDVGGLFDHIQRLGIIKSKSEQLPLDCQIEVRYPDGHTDIVIVSGSDCQWLLRDWMGVPALMWKRVEGIKKHPSKFWRFKKTGEQEFWAERTLGRHKERHWVKAHCMACAKREVAEAYGGRISIIGWQHWGKCGLRLRQVVTRQ